MTGNPLLIEEIRREIAASGGRITFARFMELALYHPQHGYYTCSREPARSNPSIPTASELAATMTPRPRIGKRGDYFTSVSVGPLFGRILARQFQQWRTELATRRATFPRRPSPANRGADPSPLRTGSAAPSGDFEIIEFGGHRGQLRKDVLAAAPELPYRVIEAGEPLPERINGIVFSNELLDALPVHRLCGEQEVYVTGNFTEELGHLSDPRLPRLPAGCRSEINLRAIDWLEAVACRMETGYILTIDYGFDRAEYFAPYRHEGHLQCYYRHTKSANPYEHIGEQDITAHVEFSSLIERGEQLGLETVLFTDQSHFLLQAGKAEITEIVQRTAGQFSSERNAIHQLLHSTMGQSFKVLVQRKKE